MKIDNPFLEWAARGMRMPIGTDLVLSEKPGHDAIKRDGRALGMVMAEAADRWGVPIAVPLMDLTLEKEWLAGAFGVSAAEAPTWHWHGGVPGDLPDAPLTERLLANNRAIQHIAGETGLLPCGMGIGPFSLVTKLLADPITPVFLAGMGESDDEEVLKFEGLLELATRTVIRMLDTQIDAGAKAVVICEPAANTVYFSPKQLEEGADTYQRYVLETNRRVAERMRERGVARIFHDCGELTDQMVRDLAALRPEMLSLGGSRRLWEDATLIPDDVVLYGNLPSKQFYSDEIMPVDKVRAMARDLDERMAATRHPFILGSECDVLDVPGSGETIRAKVKAMLSC